MFGHTRNVDTCNEASPYEVWDGLSMMEMSTLFVLEEFFEQGHFECQEILS
jgi:hypothetical protein